MQTPDVFHKPFNYDHYSPVHRQQGQLRVAKKTLRFLLILGWALGFAAVVFLLIGVAANVHHERGWFSLGGILLGIAVVCLVLGWLGDLLLPMSQRLSRNAGRGKPARHRRRHRITSTRQRPANEGVILIAVLILVSLMGALVLSTQVATQLLHQERGAALQTVVLRQAATEGVKDALMRLANDDDLEVDHPDEPWAELIEIVDPSGVTIRTETVDENRYFDINNLSVPEQTTIRPAAEILKDVMVLCGDVNPAERIDALRDWIDEDEEGLHESIDEDTAVNHAAPANRVLLGWGELLRVEGFDREAFRREEDLGIQDAAHGDLVDAVTVLPTARDNVIPINLNTAGYESLYGVLGIENNQLLDQILTRREQGPIRPEDAAQFSVDPDLIQQLGPYLTVDSAFFRVQSTAFLGSHSETVRALVHRDDEGNVAILHWVL